MSTKYHFNRIILTILFLCFFLSTILLFSAEKIFSEKTPFTDHLVPDYVNATFPIDTVKSDKVILGSVLLGLARTDATLYSSKDNFFAHRNNRAIGIFTEGSFSVPIVDGEKTSLVFFIPCFVTNDESQESRLYYASLAVSETGETNVAVFSEDEFNTETKDIESQLKLPQDFFDQFFVNANEEFQEKGAVYALHIGDDAVGLAMNFLEKVSSPILRKRLEVMAKQNRIKMIKDPTFKAGDIIINSDKTLVKQRAIAIIVNLLVVEGFTRADISEIIKVFNIFWENSEAFDINNIPIDKVDPRIKDVLVMVDRRLKDEAENEGGITFSPRAYSTYIDVSDIGIEDCGEVIEDIKDIYQRVFRNEIDEHNRKRGVVPAGEADINIEVKLMGVKPEDGFATSEGTVATTRISWDREKRKATVILNDNFVKVMKVLIDRGIRDTWKGEVNDIGMSAKRLRNPYIGNLYKSILYSIALHERGHLHVNDLGKVIFQPDEALVKGARGRKYLYVNLLSTMYFWLVIVEGNDIERIGTRLIIFMNEYPELFSGLTDTEKGKLRGHLNQLMLDFGIRRDVWLNDMPRKEKIAESDRGDAQAQDENLQRGLVTMLDKAKRITTGLFRREKEDEPAKEILEEKDITPRNILDVLSEEEGPVSQDVLREKLPMYDEARIDWCLIVLVDELGLVDRIMINGVPRYRIVPIEPVQMKKVRDLLKENEKIGQGIIDLKLKGDIREVIDVKWPTVLASLLEEYTSRQAAAGETGKKLLYIDTSWIPEDQLLIVQRLIQKLDHMEKFGIIVERGSGKEGIEKLKSRMEKEEIPTKDVIILGNSTLLNYDNVKPLIAESEIDIKKAFFVGVESHNLSGNTYIRFMEMLSIAVQVALNDSIILEMDNYQNLHPKIDITVKNRRILLLIPEAERLNFDDIKSIYDAQARTLLSA